MILFITYFIYTKMCERENWKKINPSFNYISRLINQLFHSRYRHIFLLYSWNTRHTFVGRITDISQMPRKDALHPRYSYELRIKLLCFLTAFCEIAPSGMYYYVICHECDISNRSTHFRSPVAISGPQQKPLFPYAISTIFSHLIAQFVDRFKRK